MIRGIGVYVDGNPHVRVDGHLDVGTAFATPDVAVLQSMWAEAREGGSDSFVWLGLRNPELGELELAARVFGIDDLHIEDAMSIGQRPRIEISTAHVFAVLKVLDYVEPTSDVETGQIAVWVGPSYVLSARIGEPGDLTGLRSELEGDPQMLALGPLAVLHGILDVVIDGYQDVVDELAKDIEEVEERVFSDERTDDAAAIYLLKRENLEVRRAIDPLSPVADHLVHEQLPDVPDALLPYFRDLGDHLLRVQELCAQHDILLATVLEAARSRQAVQQNDDMRKISAYVGLAAVPTMVAGIYGMNFDNIPELHWEYGYFIVVGLMVLITTLLYRAFKRSGWL